ncbi:MAG: alpha/beta fold hydrolase, partial [Chloroflexota bacterium]
MIQVHLLQNVRLPVVFALIPLLLLIVFSPASIEGKKRTQVFSAKFQPSDCIFDIGSATITPDALGFECGYVTAPEQHSVPDGPTIRLPVIVRKSTAENRKPDPILIAQGGPGADIFKALVLQSAISPIAADRDIVLFNQRGTKYAEPRLHCTEPYETLSERLIIDDEERGKQLSEEDIERCRARFVAEGLNLAAFNSLENAQDIDLIRQALGYEQYNFYGVSYGTLLGLHLMRLNPPHLRAVILDSVVSPQTNFIPNVGQTHDRAYDVYFAVCAKNTACSEMYPNLEARLTAVYDKLSAQPMPVLITNKETGDVIETSYDDQDVASLMFNLFYVPKFYSIFPRLVEDLERGDLTFFENFASGIIFSEDTSLGMQLSVLCAEDGDFTLDDVDVEGLRPITAQAGTAYAELFFRNCQIWNVDQLPNSIDAPVVSDIPTLLISGQLDPITPPSYAAKAAETLSNGYNIVNPLGSHGNVWGGDDCSIQIVQNFLDNPRQGPDDSCYADLEQLKPIEAGAFQSQLMRDYLDFIQTGQLGSLALLATLAVLSLVLLSGVIFWPVAAVVNHIRNHTEQIVQGTGSIIGYILPVLTGLSGLLLTGGIAFYLQAAVSNFPYVFYGALPSNARPVFFLAPVILLLIITSLISLFRSIQGASIGSKTYQALLMLSLVGVG